MAAITPKYFVLRPEEFRGVRSLCLDGEIGPWLNQLANSPNLGQVTTLSLRGGGGVSLIQALIASPYLTRLSELTLRACGITAEAAGVLAGSPLLAQLTCLDLGANRLGPSGLRLLLESPYFTQVTRLDLSGSVQPVNDWAGGFFHDPNVGSEGIVCLAASPAAARLRVLNLALNEIDDRGVQALVASEFLAGVICLQVLEPQGASLGLREEAVRALRERFGDRVSVSPAAREIQGGGVIQIEVPFPGVV
jgi:hypothetical protein